MKHYPQFQQRHYPQGDCIFLEGDIGDMAYFIEEGTVEIFTLFQGNKKILNILKEGGMFGELALLDGRPRSASAIAKTNTILTVITLEQIQERILSADPILRMFLLVLTSYIRSETSNFRPQANQRAEQLLEREESLQDKISEAVNIIRLESELGIALDQDQFRLVFQPIVNLENLEIVGFEALLRWYSPKRGLVSPNIFIPVAESTSLIIPIGEWIVEESVKALKILEEKAGREIFMSINIASRQIYDLTLPTLLVNACDQVGVSPHQIKLEIIERSLFDKNIAIPWLERCKELGFLIALDDFGSGYSSLAYISQYKPHTVKIDKSLIDDFTISRESRSICHAIMEMGKDLEMSIVAEGIESSEQLEILRQMGCTFGQGYLFAKPLPLDAAIALL